MSPLIPWAPESPGRVAIVLVDGGHLRYSTVEVTDEPAMSGRCVVT